MIRVRFAELADQPRLIEFLRDHWSATHIFVQRPDVFAWQHAQPDGRLNMVFAEKVEDDSSVVLGVLGFIPMGRFDPALGDRDVTLAIWKVREDGVPPGLGLRLLKFLQAELAPRLVGAIGISDIVGPIYKVLGYDVGTLGHAAVFNPDRSGSLRIASGVPAAAFRPSDPPAPDVLSFVPIDESAPAEVTAAIDAMCAAAAPPVKSWRYLAERYVRHPWYRYQLRAIRHHGEITSVMVWRAVEANESRVLRIVDIVGDAAWLGDARSLLQHEVAAAEAEYIDLVHWGVDEDMLARSGFVTTPFPVSDVVLPNHFSPFEQRNITIAAAVKVGEPGHTVRLFRADSDQDRPNVAADLEPVLE